MASFKGYDREDGQKRRQGLRKARRNGIPSIEFLEQRQLLTGNTNVLPAPLWTPSDPGNLLDAQNGPMANLGAGTVDIYAAYLKNGGNTSQLAAEFPSVEFENGLVGLNVKSLGGDFSQFVTQLTNVGMQITTTSAPYAMVDGYVPVNELPSIAKLSQTMSGELAYRPQLGASPVFQGAAYNEAETSMFADVARTEFGVDGTGITIGALSDSVNQFQGGLSESYGTGDLNPNDPVNVIQDNPNDATDEGRAMLENIHDIAPGANLQFATATINEVQFGANIEALQKAGSQIIVDDVTYADEPMFQDGIVAQAVNTVTAQGVTYFSDAENEGPDSGYLSNFRASSGTVTGIGAGTFMNFNPSGASNLLLPITTGINNAEITFQFDQPYQFQEPAGSSGVVSSNVNIYVIDAATGAVVVGAAQNQNNVATQQPWQFITIPTAGSYEIAVQVVSGPNPGHIQFSGFNDTNGAVNVSQQYGSAGGTSYPSTWGHHTTANNVGVGATPWWAPAPYLGQNPLANEPFSSTGPALSIFNVNGVPLPAPVTVNNPTITAPDGGNTSFFAPGEIINTANPPNPGEPATGTNLSQNLPSFFGTSSAAPNAAAVAALMLQEVPTLTPAQIRQGLINGATPMNGTPAGSWNTQSGYGLVNAINAINAVNLLRVVATSPANGSTVTVSPSAITVTFNKAVNFSTVSAADLVFNPNPTLFGVTINIGAPIAVGNAVDPTVVQFPISFTRAAGAPTANGAYTFSIQSPANKPVESEDGKSLVPSGPISFTLADVTSPTITGTKFTGRTVSITFSKALDPATVTLQNFEVLRQGPVAAWPPTPTTLSNYINLNTDPRTTISYNPTTFTVTLNYSALPQTELPSDKYAIVVLSPTGTSSGVTDLVGNPLFGLYTGRFPTGVGETTPQDFIQNIGPQTLAAPIITTFVMTPTANNDTGIVGDQNTMITNPTFIGQVFASFPGTVANLQVLIEFTNTTNQGNLTLAVGGGGRGFTGTFTEMVTTDANGAFTVTSSGLLQGFQKVVAVVIGEPDQPPLPGLSSSFTDAFRIDLTDPVISGASFLVNGTPLPLPNSPAPNITPVPGLTTLTLNVTDAVSQFFPTLETPSTVVFDALNPTTAQNISNYSLINTSQNDEDESQFILTATYVADNPTPDPTNTFILAYNGHINLTFAVGLPAGQYLFVAHTTELQYPGITDAAGNPLDDTQKPPVGPGLATKDFVIKFDVQPQPVFITSMALESNYSGDGSTVIGTEQSYFELPPSNGTNTRDNVPAPPNAVVIDFSNPLPFSTAGVGGGQVPINYAADVQLISSADGAGGTSDGDFGTLGEGGMGSTGTGFTVLTDTTVVMYTLTSGGTWVPTTAGGSGTRLVLTTATTLSADDYRVYLPNQVNQLPSGTDDTRIFDIYGNQLDGENLGNQSSQSSPDFNDPAAPVAIPDYEDLQSNGTSRPDDMSGDGVAGGAFMAAFTVVNYGNVVFARPDYVENPLVAGTLSDGSLAKPYPVLAPEGNPNTAPPNPTHDPNGGLNSTFFYQPGHFNTAFDFSGDGQFEQSALYAASQLSFASGFSQGGPVIVVALPGIPQRNPITGDITEAAFVLQAPAGNNSGVTSGSTSVPYNTTLVFSAGSTLKMQNASLYVQNQGSALQAQGTTSDPVNFTSYNDASIGGATNNNPDTNPNAGDWGGIVFRNFDQAAQPTVTFNVNGPATTLVGANGGMAVSGASDAMSILNDFNIRYGGGAVPQGTSNFFSGITLFNSRPAITNGSVADTGVTGGTEAAIAGDLDSFREDDTARGPLIRQMTVTGNSLNGLYLMSEANGFIEPTNAMPNYPTNPTTLGGSQNYTFFEPLPFIVLAQLVIGEELLVNTGGNGAAMADRLYIQPGVMIKFNKGSGLNLINPGNAALDMAPASINIGSRSYINGFDQDNNYSPADPGPNGFVEESAADFTVLFTSIYDDLAVTKLVPNPINVTGENATQSKANLVPGSWGSVGIQSGAIAVINKAQFQYGGGEVNTQNFTIPSQSVLAFITVYTDFTPPPGIGFNPDLGSHVYITNNNFFNNFDAAMQIEPNGLLAGNPLTPLASGDPFLRGNVMTGNGIDGLMVLTDQLYLYTNNFASYLGPEQSFSPVGGFSNLTVDSVWDLTDITYVLKGTLIIAGAYDFGFDGQGFSSIPVPSLTTYTTTPPPVVSLTIQSALPGTLLADGETIPSPGQSVIVKLFNDVAPNDVGTANLGTNFGSTGLGATQRAGAGFVVGVDDGIDPTSPSPLVDPGSYSELRILGIPGNQTTGQQRVPVIITSLRDGTVGTTVRGVVMDNIWNSAPVEQFNAGGTALSLTTPAAGDGGYIYIGAESLNEYDPTNPLEGSLIDNADISYMSRIEIQGGGIIDSINNITGTAGAPTLTSTDWFTTLNGYQLPVNQLNSAFAFTIDDSNLSWFSDAAVFVHPDSVNALYRDWTGVANNQIPPPPKRGGLVGEPVDLYMFNDTISNSGQGVHINGSQGDNTTGDTPYQATLLNNTFFDDAYDIQTIAPAFDAKNGDAIVNVLAMNNIFDGASQVAVNLGGPGGPTTAGQAGDSQLQYNLYFNNIANLLVTTNDGDFEGNVGAVFADPQFVGPVGKGNASAQNFELEPTSPAINSARSEIGPLPEANAIFPAVDLTLNGGVVTETRTNPNAFPPFSSEEPGRLGVDSFGIEDPRQIVTLPGSGFFSFPDEWTPTITGGFSSPNSVAGTYNYVPVEGQRDILGFIRAPQAGTPAGTGFGSNPFMDIGAYQFVDLHPPQVTGVTETLTQGATPVNFYTVGGISGVNQTPWTINVTFNGPISPNTINANTVNLVDLGSNPSQPLDQPINLSGKLSYISATNTLVISLAASGLTLGTDAYQITLFGSGSPVLTNAQGVALDGENTVGGTSTGAQLALPSGNGYPGGNFFDSFIINTTPPAVLPGSLMMDPASDTNIVGDNITMSGLPTFDGKISEANPGLVPLVGQTAVLDIGIETVINGVPTTYFNPAVAPSNLAQFIRLNSGTALTTAGGAFAVTVGLDGANTGLVNNTSDLLDLTGTYNVGLDGKLAPLPGDDSGYYVARVRIIDQSGNQSNTADPNAKVPFVVDNTPPTATFTSPTAGQVITSLPSGGVLQFTVTTSQNIDITHFTAASITVTSAGPDGILGTSDDVLIPVNPSSITVTYLDAGTGGPGSEQISFSTLASTPLTNNLYAVSLLNTGPDAVRDIAGNLLANPVTQTFALAVPSLAQNLFVEQGADPTTATGSRENPYATISAAMTAATAGDVVAVLPGVYQEQVTMKQFVRLLSASTTSTDTTVFTTSTGDALSTIIRAPFQAAPPAGTYATITASGLESLSGLTTEIAGFTIASPLVIDPASGTINPGSVAVNVMNSNITLDKDYVIDAGTGIQVTTTGPTAITPSIFNDGIVGNIAGVTILDAGATPASTPPVQLINDDFAFNTTGLLLDNTATSPIQAYVASNIFWENHDQTLARNGFAIFSQTQNKVNLQNNMFYGNGASETNQSNATNALGNGFSPLLLGTTASAAQGNLGNYIGNPAFVFPIDPRPGSDGPANFYIDADFDLTSISAAIDNAWEGTAKPTDFLGNSQVKISGAGFGLPGYGPRDVGAFEFDGTGGQGVGGAFRVVTTSLVPIGGALFAGGATDAVTTSPTSITVTFSGNVNPSDISATDLVLSGSALNSSSPAHATSLTWIDAHTVEFNLAGQFNTTGTVNLSIAPNSIGSTTGQTNPGYSDNLVLKIVPIATPTPTPTSTPSPTSTRTSSPGPAPAPSPVPAPHGPLHKKKPVVVHHAKKVVVKHVVVKHKVEPKQKAKPVAHKLEPKVAKKKKK